MYVRSYEPNEDVLRTRHFSDVLAHEHNREGIMNIVNFIRDNPEMTDNELYEHLSNSREVGIYRASDPYNIGTEFIVDDLIAPVVILLNQKGYMTKWSCAGHFYQDPECEDEPYTYQPIQLTFEEGELSKDRIEKLHEQMRSFEVTFYSGEYVRTFYINFDNKCHFIAGTYQFLEAHKILLNWARDLPYKKGFVKTISPELFNVAKNVRAIDKHLYVVNVKNLISSESFVKIVDDDELSNEELCEMAGNSMTLISDQGYEVQVFAYKDEGDELIYRLQLMDKTGKILDVFEEEHEDSCRLDTLTFIYHDRHLRMLNIFDITDYDDVELITSKMFDEYTDTQIKDALKQEGMNVLNAKLIDNVVRLDERVKGSKSGYEIQIYKDDLVFKNTRHIGRYIVMNVANILPYGYWINPPYTLDEAPIIKMINEHENREIQIRGYENLSGEKCYDLKLFIHEAKIDDDLFVVSSPTNVLVFEECIDEGEYYLYTKENSEHQNVQFSWDEIKDLSGNELNHKIEMFERS